jgi:hypothetical protein
MNQDEAWVAQVKIRQLVGSVARDLNELADTVGADRVVVAFERDEFAAVLEAVRSVVDSTDADVEPLREHLRAFLLPMEPPGSDLRHGE